ncbi:conserved repeat domain-containing protein/fimbrial isopeptide formation D2 domain-containing protein [Anaerosphaera aminiphila DSM 21120]|uniref:Conserved repeat domain-containing protein/fimbrial isopeptide formation D2 domain-containing protein n=1 Tax=Anaerosphaera aminiphila DSM 21120 TaxID=1120995 RepID=A0A1M5UTT3_9FIRM|nr:S-layer homology domain-containing protein [Anaerosphaera aminiphila]SHH66133.1 conserved repeat domain-containing protein/fimbrial isopeptide formation D2 domain-containing protein [Anaerosphaera aminiphila DSM 21120]
MKKVISCILAFVMLLGIFPANIASASSEPDNLIKNPEFKVTGLGSKGEYNVDGWTMGYPSKLQKDGWYNDLWPNTPNIGDSAWEEQYKPIEDGIALKSIMEDNKARNRNSWFKQEIEIKDMVVGKTYEVSSKIHIEKASLGTGNASVTIRDKNNEVVYINAIDANGNEGKIQELNGSFEYIGGPLTIQINSSSTETLEYIVNYTGLKLQRVYKVNYDANTASEVNGNLPKDDRNYKNGENVAVNNAETLLREGYEFKGWALAKDSKEPVTTIDNISEDTTLYVIWEEILPEPGKLESSKIVDKTEATRGEEITYYLFLENTGETELENIEIEDTVPEELEKIDAISNEIPKEDLNVDGNKITGKTNLKAGEEKIIFITGTIKGDAVIGTKFSNTAKVTNPLEAGNPQRPKSEETEVTAKSGEITAEKTVDKTEVNPGDEVNYTLKIKNTGESDLNNLLVEDNVPIELEDVTAGNDLTVDGNKVFGKVNIEAKSEINIEITGKVKINVETDKSFLNTATITNPDDDKTINVTSELTKILPGIEDLEGKIEVNTIEITTGGEITYTITLENTGTTRLIELELVDEMPEYLEDIKVKGIEFYTVEGNNVSITLEIDPGEVKTIEISGTLKEGVESGESIVNTITIYEYTDPVKQITFTSESVTVIPKPGKLEATKEVDKSEVKRGEKLTYTIKLKNSGETKLENIEVIDYIPLAIDTKGLTATGIDNITIAEGMVKVNVDLEPKEEKTLIITGTIAEHTVIGESFSNFLTITDPSEPLIPITPTSGETKVIAKEGNPVVTKVADKKEVTRGEELTYTIAIENTGESKLKDIEVEDEVPSQLENVTVEGNSGVKAVGNKISGKVDVEIGETIILTVKGNVKNDADLEKGFTNTVTVVDPNNPEEPIEEISEKTKVVDKPSTETGWTWSGGSSTTSKESPKTEEVLTHIAYLNGYPDNTIRPQGSITRAEVATIFARLKVGEANIPSGTTNYSDVNSSDWYTKYIVFVTDNNIMEGYGDGSFKPNDKITRAEFTAVVASYSSLVNVESSFEDVSGHWAEKYIGAVTSKGWINGYPDGTFKSEKDISREEVATMVNKMLDRKVDKDGLNNLVIKNFTDLDENSWSYFDMIEASNSHKLVRRTLGDIMENWKELL